VIQAISKERLAALIKLRAERLGQNEQTISTVQSLPIGSPIRDSREESRTETNDSSITVSGNNDQNSGGNIVPAETTDKYGNSITYNDKQSEFINLVVSGRSAVLIGAAGTGKTTCQKGATQALIQSNRIPILRNHDHKYLPDGVPGIVICAFTRRATNNIRRNVSGDMQGNCITIHKLLEYEPVYYDIIDSVSGKAKKTMRFEPGRNSSNPLPQEVKCIIFEEGSMISTSLHQEVIDAAPADCQFIYLGDIQQLPPVFGSAILGYKLLELPVVELTEVYRQAFDSPIIKLAHRILSGIPIPANELKEWNVPGKLKIHPWQKRISADSATLTLAKLFVNLLDKGEYNPETDAILIPFNKACGTLELNRHIANKLAKQNERPVWEIIHGFKKSYYSIGDKVLYDREDATVQNIYTNPEYSGAQPQAESTFLDYWGHKKREAHEIQAGPNDDIDFLLRQVAVPTGDDDEKTRAASHIIELYLFDSDRTIRIKQAGELNNLILGYALTVHKSQGSEWEKVFLCLHQSHAVMLQRELLYTAVTRAKKELVVICEDDTFVKGIESQRIKGNTLEEKAEFFKGKIANGDEQS
jgi:exodeoxyribonuclease V alpha subunit